jgi:hypothetical protein
MALYCGKPRRYDLREARCKMLALWQANTVSVLWDVVGAGTSCGPAFTRPRVLGARGWFDRLTLLTVWVVPPLYARWNLSGRAQCQEVHKATTSLAPVVSGGEVLVGPGILPLILLIVSEIERYPRLHRLR